MIAVLAPHARAYKTYMRDVPEIVRGIRFYAYGYRDIKGHHGLQIHLLDGWYCNKEYTHNFMEELKRALSNDAREYLDDNDPKKSDIRFKCKLPFTVEHNKSGEYELFYVKKGDILEVMTISDSRTSFDSSKEYIHPFIHCMIYNPVSCPERDHMELRINIPTVALCCVNI